MEERATTERTLDVRFDVFGWRVLGERAGLNRETVGDVIAAACSFYAERLEMGPRVPAVPRFKPRPVAGQDVQIPAPARHWEVIERESVRAGVALEQVVEHAVFVYLEAIEQRRRGGPGRSPAGPRLSPKA